MSEKKSYSSKFSSICKQTSVKHLPDEIQKYVSAVAHEYRFTLQELRQFTEITLDLEQWNCESITRIWDSLKSDSTDNRTKKKSLLQQLQQKWLELKSEPNRYSKQPVIQKPQLPTPKTTTRDQLGLGYCPVASDKTRCCNLLTLDAVENCGFDCSYCSIQSFYHGNEVKFDSSFAEKLSKLELDPNRIYHIGTGQSSDSLMWGNNHNILDSLIQFAKTNPNVILELKSKSANITHLSQTKIPPNIICTWSLNTQTIIDNEEHGTASLERRLQAARTIADNGALIGFHFHPIIHYKEWKKDYTNLFQNLQQMFNPSEVAMISLGTLTFIKPVIKKIRERSFHSQILKMPMEEAAGKLSYPIETKLQLFRHAYHSFSREWQKQVFFYLCMEDHSMWNPVFGYQYQSNDELEESMKQSYLQSIENRRQHEQ